MRIRQNILITLIIIAALIVAPVVSSFAKDLSIDADQITVDGENNRLTISGNASLTFNNAVIKTEKCDIYLDDNHEIEKIIIDSDLRAVINNTQVITAKYAEYDNIKHTLFLKGDVNILSGEKVMHCNNMIYNNLTLTNITSNKKNN